MEGLEDSEEEIEPTNIDSHEISHLDTRPGRDVSASSLQRQTDISSDGSSASGSSRPRRSSVATLSRESIQEDIIGVYDKGCCSEQQARVALERGMAQLAAQTSAGQQPCPRVVLDPVRTRSDHSTGCSSVGSPSRLNSPNWFQTQNSPVMRDQMATSNDSEATIVSPYPNSPMRAQMMTSNDSEDTFNSPPRTGSDDGATHVMTSIRRLTGSGAQHMVISA